MDNTLTKLLLSQNPSLCGWAKLHSAERESQSYMVLVDLKEFPFKPSFSAGLTKPVVIVVHDKDHKEMWERDLAFSLPNIPVLSFPITDQCRLYNDWLVVLRPKVHKCVL